MRLQLVWLNELAVPYQYGAELDRRLICGGMPKVVGNTLIGRVSVGGKVRYQSGGGLLSGQSERHVHSPFVYPEIASVANSTAF